MLRIVELQQSFQIHSEETTLTLVILESRWENCHHSVAPRSTMNILEKD